MKRLFLSLLCFAVAISLCACTSKETVQESSFIRLESMEELREYLSQEPAEVAMSFTAEEEPIYVPNEEQVSGEFNADLSEIVLDNNNFYFRFKVRDANLNLANEYDPTNGALSEEESIDSEMARACSEDLMIGWQRNSNGEDVLNALAESNPLYYWEEHPGYYYTTSPYNGMEDPLGYMIYWVQDSHFFQASVPAEKLDIFWENCETMIGDLL